MFPDVVALFDMDLEKAYKEYMEMEKKSMTNRKRVLIFPSVHGTTIVINCDAENNSLNGFLSAFDIWNGKCDFKLSDDNEHYEAWFEMDCDFYMVSKCDTLRKAIERFGVEVVHDYHTRG